MRALAVLALAVGFACGAPVPAGAEPMSDQTARHRIAALLDPAQAGAESDRVGLLAEIADRVEDRSLAGLAAFNAGTLALGAGDGRAGELLRRAETLSPDPALRASARYNLGHASMPTDDAPPTDAEEAARRLEALRLAADHFRSVLDVDPGHADAAANTERVRRRIREMESLRSELEARERAKEELAEQLSELARQQDRRADESEARARRGEAPDEGDKEAQRSVSERTDRADERADQAGADEGTREAIERAREAQRRAQEAMEEGDAGEAGERQREAAEALREAAERAAGRADAPGESGEAGDEAGGNDGREPDDPEDEPGEGEGPGSGIDPLAEALLDKERREREQRAQYLQRGQRQRVERDW